MYDLAHSPYRASVEQVSNNSTTDCDLVILYEDAQVIAVAKPAGVLTQPAPGCTDSLLVRAQRHLGQRPGLVHRLDRPVSGAVVLAKNSKTTRWLNRCFREGKVSKLYLALVRTGLAPVVQDICEPIGKVAQGKMQVTATGKPSRTTVIPIGFDPAAEMALVGLQLHSGRTHQARVHLAAEVGAIVGDQKYGDVTGAPRIALHAAVVALPASKNVDQRIIVCPPDESFWQLGGGARLSQDNWQGALMKTLG